MSCFIKCFKKNVSSDDSMRAKERSEKIDHIISKDKRFLRNQVSLLLLGAGESGKSTFLKQMKIIYETCFEKEMIEEYKLIIYQNVIKGMKVLIDARNKLDIAWGDESNHLLANHVFQFDTKNILTTQVFLDYAPCIIELWKDPGIRNAYDRRSEFQLSDGVRYFFDNLRRIAVNDYVPTNQDILCARKATKGITEYTVTINEVPFKFIDVGGQRSQRQKWFQCFDKVSSILFLVSSSEYDQVLLEDRQTNRLTESLDIFSTIVNYQCFKDVSIILFLNKTDLLIEKLERTAKYVAEVENIEKENDNEEGDKLNKLTHITCSNHETKPSNHSHTHSLTNQEIPRTFDHYFPEFTGDPLNIVQIQSFMLGLFESQRKDKSSVMFYHFTTAIDTDNIKHVFNDVKKTILEKNIKLLMLE